MAPFAGEPELREDLEEMQRQIGRCKTIVSGILSSAGETRGEAPVQTTLHAFLDGLVEAWKRTRGKPALAYERAGRDLPIISDTALQQMVHNILDNALEAAPGLPLRLHAEWDEDTLTLRVRDQGPGFPPAMLERLGTPYQSSKGTPGRGLGLFLAVNVARTLGGRIAAHNVAGGAEVTITLPLAAVVLEEEDEEEETQAIGAADTIIDRNARP
jgi:two-component system sensor histidine kinase RegB